MAVDEEWGFSKNGTMPWPKNTEDLQHFKETTNNKIQHWVKRGYGKMVKPLSTSDVFLDEESAKKKAKNNQDPNSSKGRSNEIDMRK